jgi:hypothetical protein
MLAPMKTTKLIPAALAALALGGATTATATAAGARSAAARHFEGRVVSVDRAARTFRLRDSGRGSVRIRVTSSTSFERIAGFGALRVGMRRVEATVRRSNGRWVATRVERSGGGGRHGGGGRGRDHPEDD